LDTANDPPDPHIARLMTRGRATLAQAIGAEEANFSNVRFNIDQVACPRMVRNGNCLRGAHLKEFLFLPWIHAGFCSRTHCL